MRAKGAWIPVICLLPALPAAAATLLHCGRLIDGLSSRVATEQTVVIEDGRIVAVERGYRSPGASDDVIDLRAFTVLPGLIDMHTHLNSELSPKSYQDRFMMNEADFAMRAVAHAWRTLMAGFTTVRDLGDDGHVTVALRHAIAAGLVNGPRIYTAGKSIATTGGHADPTNGWRADIQGDPGPKEGVINGAEDARKAVRQRYKDGADLIKLTATGGVLSLAKNGQNPQFTDEELRAVVAAARDYGFKVAVHAHGTEGMKRAILAGVDSIEHGTFMTDEVIQLMKKHGTYYVPTILAGVFVGEKAKEKDYFPAVVVPKAAEIGPQIQHTFARAVKAGVKIAFGTDSGVSPHGENAREFALMVEAGMAPMAAIQAATSVAAELLGASEELGSISAGKFADLVAVEGDPLADIALLEAIPFVMQGGVVRKSLP